LTEGVPFSRGGSPGKREKNISKRIREKREITEQRKIRNWKRGKTNFFGGGDDLNRGGRFFIGPRRKPKREKTYEGSRFKKKRKKRMKMPRKGGFFKGK